MNATYMVTSDVVIDDVLKIMYHSQDSRATLSDAEILTVAVVAAQYFHNHHERALYLRVQLGYLLALSISRFNRCLDALREVLWQVATLLGEGWAEGRVFVIDPLPLPLCKVTCSSRVRPTRCGGT